MPIEIDLSLNRLDYFNIKLPKANENTYKMNLFNKNEVDFLNLIFDPKTFTSYIKIDRSKIKATGAYELIIKLFNA